MSFRKIKRWVLMATLFAFASIINVDVYAAGVHGVFRVVKGKVQIQSGKTGKKKRARVGKKVYPEDVIITGKNARVKIVMVDKNEINISPESQVKIEKYEYDPAKGKKDVLLNVIYGKVRNKVKQKYDGKQAKFRVKTPSAVAGVRGMDFLTNFDAAKQRTEIVTFEGKVQFGLPGANGGIRNAVDVGLGQVASITRGQLPTPPTNMDRGSMAKFDQESDAEKAPDVGGERQPAGDGAKGPAPKNDEGENGREPASMDPGPGPDGESAMINQEELQGEAGPVVRDPASTGGTDTAFMPPPPPPPDTFQPPKQDFCGDFCRDANNTVGETTRINVIINQPGQ